jgi:hypothetical protein
MRHVFISALVLSPAIILASGATYLAVHGIDGWGWFLFVAAFAGSYSYREKD